ncbi:MAG: SusC/RagA family TonB-linked outer membrane protein [Breznakibacter sp.]|nr:SusC/RagA family TonB-linked outer membrane protein [Breznakibacter sp.]
MSPKQNSNSPQAPKGQKRSVSGVVTDPNGQPIPGATVVDKNNMSVGTVTDLDGNYSLLLDGDHPVLVVSFIGMKPQQIDADFSKVMKVRLEEESLGLEEVVVTAMGIERKAKSLTYATQKMDNEELMRVQDANFINSLQGKAAGLSITPTAGGAGGSSKILLRGNKSILGSNTPLIVVDGVPMSNPVKGQQGVGGGESMGYSFVSEGSDALSSINPDDIESINILKGANAAALYGSAASNGVLMITTKKGKEGKMSVNITSNATFEKPLVLPNLQNKYGAELDANGKVQIKSWGDKISNTGNVEGLTNNPQDYLEDFYLTGHTFNNSISISGGTQKILSYFSYGNSSAKGMVDKNNFNRHTVSFRQSYNLFKDNVKFDVAINYLNQETKNRPGGGTSLNPLYHLYTSPRNVDMNHYRNNFEKDGTWQSGLYGHYKKTDSGYSWVSEKIDLKGAKQNWIYDAKDENNPYWLLNRTKIIDKQERVYGYLSGSVKIVDGLTGQGRFSIDRAKSTSYSQRWATTQTPSGIMPWGEYWNTMAENNEFYLDWMLNYNKEFGDFSLSATSGYTAHHVEGRSQNIGTVPATIEDPRLLRLPTAINIFDINAGLTGNRNLYKSVNWDEGLFVTGQVGYKNYLFVEGSYRQDWYRVFKQFESRGLPDNYGYYAFGANTLVHEYLTLPPFWNYMKVRTSYSEVGNSIPNIIFDATKIDPLTGAATPSPYAYFENPVPEKTKSFEAGFDASFFRNSLTWDATFYSASMNNNYLLMSVAGKSKPVNTGVIRNMGVETSLGYSMNISNDIQWKSSFNFSYNDNKIIETYKENGKEMLIDQKIGFGGKVQVRYSEGGSYGDIYVTDFARDKDGRIILGSTGLPSLSNKKFTKYMGNMNAPVMMGWNNTFTYKGVSLYFLIGGKIGGKVISFTEAYLDSYGVSNRSGKAREAYAAGNLNYKVNSELTIGDLVNNPDLVVSKEEAIANYYQGVGGDINASQYIYQGTNFRLRELSLGYTFRSLLGESKDLSLSLIGRNLFFIYKDAPVDPETSLSTQNGLGNIDVFNMPTSRSFGVSLNVNF